jgi:ABC-2 type transport system ATP-binding protein
VLRQLADDDSVEVDARTRRLTAPVSGGAEILIEALRRLDAADIELHDVALRRPTLDDVFLTLTGHRSEESDAPEEDTESELAGATR